MNTNSKKVSLKKFYTYLGDVFLLLELSEKLALVYYPASGCRSYIRNHTISQWVPVSEEYANSIPSIDIQNDA